MNKTATPGRAAAFLIFTTTHAGCYNAQELCRQRAEADAGARLEEVDLGSFQVALPHILGVATDHVVDFHAFGQVAGRDRSRVAQALQARGAKLRSDMLLAMRGLPDATFEEPQLSALRQQIIDVINGALDEKLVQQVGFYHFTFDRVE
ncbi:MAG: flagellar basal body-associated FliL family protein [Pirellulales bacterium]|nr:flagellar basal body-associated FliL family protein [Pirellulales bacterium]